MQTSTHPTKEQVRAWLLERRVHPAPLPDLASIRVQVGWVAPPRDTALAVAAPSFRYAA